MSRVTRILLLLLLPLSALTQKATLTGEVVNEEQGEPLMGAYIRIAGTDQLQSTDAKGAFRFTGLDYGSYTLIVTYTGMNELRRNIRVDQPAEQLRLRMQEAIYGLNTVIVQSEREASMGLSRLRAVEGVSIYEGKKSEVVPLADITANLAANNPRQVYARVAGLNIWESDGAGLQLGIGGRGLSPNRTSNFNTRQNGYDISADALGYPESYYTPPTEALERIEVVRGAASLQYGTQFGGMLNFVFKKPPRDKAFELVTRQSVGSFGFFNSFNSVAGTVADSKLSYYGFFQYKEGDGWRPNSDFNLQNGYASLRYRPASRLELGLEYTKMYYLAQQPGGLTDVLFERDARASFRERNYFRIDWDLLAATLDYRFNSRTRINSRLFALGARRQSLGILAPINVADLGGQRDLIDSQFDNIGNETRLLHRYNLLGQEQTFVVGTRYYRGNTNARQGLGNEGSGPDFFFLNPEDVESSDYDYDNINFAAFLEHIFYLSPRFTVTPGIRYEYIDTRAEGYFKNRVFDAAGNLITENRQDEATQQVRDFVLFGLGASFKYSPRRELYGNISQNYRAINFNDLRIDNPNGRVDPNIQDEQGFTADLGLRSRIKDWFYADVTAFYINYQDRIGWVLKADQPPLFNDIRLRTNIADARNIGLESFAELDLWHFLQPADSLGRLSVYVNASFIDSKYINTDDRSIQGREVELVPPFTFRTGLSFRRRAVSASLSWAYTAEHFTDATNARRTATAVNGLIPSYSVLDLSAAYNWRQFTLECSANNLLDQRYFTRRADSYPGPGIIPADGRSLFLTLQYKL